MKRDPGYRRQKVQTQLRPTIQQEGEGIQRRLQDTEPCLGHRGQAWVTLTSHKVHPITRKPMSWHDNLEEPADVKFLNVIHHAAHGPRMKYSETQTEAQEIGWNPRPLINPDRQDKRLNHFKVYRDITLYKAKLWRLGEENYLK
ncbi:cilia- and flagella-associated protein 144 isoform X2 [Meriones unguiculatus]|uniref:cilia- and flagella-associated protein 144 isoform X2 n=1 Tax=Meriones unguiculatus TaxID=10047 RepID=UPI00293EDBC4|nr:cilia- and flagella-associated protein 144 isoform X2 [Meriones unguiculatus]